MSNFNLNLLKNSASQINSIDDQKLSLLATRVAQHVVVAGGVTTAAPFTDTEIEKLETSLALNKNEVIEAVKEILMEAAYHNLPPEQLSQRLSSYDVDKSKADVFGAVWNKASSALTSSLKSGSVLPQVSFIGYNLTMEAGSDVSDQRGLRGIIQVGVADGEKTETLAMDFSREELSKLHQKLNRIQAQLDAIGEK